MPARRSVTTTMVAEGANGEAAAAAAATEISASFKSSIEQYQYNDSQDTTRETRSRTKRAIAAVDAVEKPVKSSKKRKSSSKYAPPSKYAHLMELVDILEPNLICVFVGTNPGVRTATAGHAYAHPSNLFWKLLHQSGCTDERLKPEQDRDLPRLYSMGNTNIVSRPSKDAAELSKAEMTAGAAILQDKFRQYRPEAVCIVGKGIWEAIWRERHGKDLKKDEFHWGWQDDSERMGKTADWAGSQVFVATSTSGLSASLRPPEKLAIWLPFGQWTKKRRAERAAESQSAEAVT